MMRAMMFNQPMTGFHMPITMPQPTFQPEGRREVQQNVVESAKLFAQHLKGLMTDPRLNASAGEPDNKELSRSQQRDNGKAPERRANKKQTSCRDKDATSKRREPLKEGIRPVFVIGPVSSVVTGKDFRVFRLTAFDFFPFGGGARDDDATVTNERRGTALRTLERSIPPIRPSGRREGFCRQRG
ncbi:unnamed protein product [Cuscuta campestris]|uniref:Uncharacterized protein n=1 Tax=Cuscuta campestris TaxID=132261 RepID=A0A484LTL8_9ASTE|nr:unnamed protein product [Cuscuta campestris]